MSESLTWVKLESFFGLTIKDGRIVNCYFFEDYTYFFLKVIKISSRDQSN